MTEKEKLEELEKLLKDGIISKEDYDKKKSEFKVVSNERNSKVKMKKTNIVPIVFFVILVFVLIGISSGITIFFKNTDYIERTSKDIINAEENIINEKLSTEDNRVVEESKQKLTLIEVSDFVNGIANVTEKRDFTVYHYIIDEKFNVLSSYEGNNTYVDGYVLIKNEDESYSVYDVNGKEVFSYGKYEYEKVELVNNGFLILTSKIETYNSSTTISGIYNLKNQKYAVEPKEEYVGNITLYGDNMICINGHEKTIFYNIKTEKIVTFSKSVPNDFSDGYSVEDDHSYDENKDFIEIWDDNGGIKKIDIKMLLDYTSIVDHKNGMMFAKTRESDVTHSEIYNLETNEIIDLGSEEYNYIKYTPQFTKDGFALLVFNNQGGTPYYTVIDKKGNRLFDPVKVNFNSSFSDNGEKRIIKENNLFEGNYILANDEGTDIILDRNNNIVAKAEEYETFLGVTNNLIKVKSDNPNYIEECYYKDLQGNRIEIYK